MNARACFVPPYLLRALDRADVIALDEQFRAARPAGPSPSLLPVTGPAWVVHSCDHDTDLPGRVVRSAGEGESGDAAVDEAAYGVAGSLALFAEVYGRSSFDGRGASVVASVHYGRDYDNAFWDGRQLVFGDGDGRVFDRFTKPVDVLGHEFTHAVTEHTAGLVYDGQSGALNESLSDVFAACLKQRLLGQSADEADWLVGEGLFLPTVHARGLRDMLNPGTAYDDPALGRDPQPAHMDGYVDTRDDNGGVHINSGIPNRAFALAATSIGGSTAEGAGRIWYAALTGPEVGPRSDFAEFAAATISAAGEHEDAVRRAWETVGVLPATGAGEAAPVPAGSATGGRPDGGSGGGSRTVTVRRTGGFAGLSQDGSVDLDADDERAPELRHLVRRVDLRAVAGEPARPDMYVYEFDLCGDCAQVPETRVTGDLRRIADLVLRWE